MSKIRVELRRETKVVEIAVYEDDVSDEVADRFRRHDPSPIVWAEHSLPTSGKLTWQPSGKRVNVEAASITIDGLSVMRAPPKPPEPIQLTKRQAEYLWACREKVTLRVRSGGGAFSRMVDSLDDKGLVEGKGWWSRTLTPTGAAELALYEQTHKTPLDPERYSRG